MNFAAIDRKTGKVVKLGDKRDDVPHGKELTVVDLKHLENQPPSTLATLYTQLTHQPARKSTRLIMKELAEVISMAGGGVSAPVEEEGPVAICRRVFATMHGRPRAEVIDTCVAQGVKASTARTQYRKLKSGQH